jgi:hypothetical protein
VFVLPEIAFLAARDRGSVGAAEMAGACHDGLEKFVMSAVHFGIGGGEDHRLAGVEEGATDQVEAMGGVEPGPGRWSLENNQAYAGFSIKGSMIQPLTTATFPTSHAGTFAFHSQRCARCPGR